MDSFAFWCHFRSVVVLRHSLFQYFVAYPNVVLRKIMCAINELNKTRPFAAIDRASALVPFHQHTVFSLGTPDRR